MLAGVVTTSGSSPNSSRHGGFHDRQYHKQPQRLRRTNSVRRCKRSATCFSIHRRGHCDCAVHALSRKHGSLGSSVPRQPRRKRVPRHMFDYSGLGLSSGPRDYNPFSLARDAHDLAEALQLERFAIAATSPVPDRCCGMHSGVREDHGAHGRGVVGPLRDSGARMPIYSDVARVEMWLCRD
jgi:hypothetical protein